LGWEYLSSSQLDVWTRECSGDANLARGRDLEPHLPPEVRPRYRDFRQFLLKPQEWRADYNERFIAGRMLEVRQSGLRGLGTKLTDAQLRAIVTNDDNTLVLAGAGSGKTMTIVARAAYLVDWKLARPEEILLLAFNKSVAGEVRGRLTELEVHGVEVSTFHRKGYAVLGELLGRKPAVSALATDDRRRREFLQGIFEERWREDAFFRKLARWWVEFRVPEEELAASETPDERIRKERSYDLRSLTGVKLASQAEVRVANWLTLSGFIWEHEARYPHAPPSPDRREYTPDFFLPEHDIWIEVWSSDRHGNLREDIDRNDHFESMKWKRELHVEHETKLLEVFQDEIREGRLGEVLEEKLEALGAEVRPPTQEVRERLIGKEAAQISQFVGLIDSFLNLMRGGGWSWDETRGFARSKRDRAFLSLFEPFLLAYEEALAEEEKLDFHEMLSGVHEHPEQLSAVRRYRHLIVDECQDLSRTRVMLLEALRAEGVEGRLFAVGDDWQAIYHFAGADPSVLVELEAHAGPTTRVALDRTFRLVSDVAEVSTRFITKNPRQIRKELLPNAPGGGVPAVCVCVPERGSEGEALKWCVNRIDSASEGGAEVLLLARYHHALESDPVRELRAGLPPGMTLRTSTVHRAKGLEADYTIVIGLEAGIYGFPSEISDDPVLRMVTGTLDAFPNAEERRLFYVALTRSRNRVFLIGSAEEPSTFLQELREDEYAGWVEWVGRFSEVLRCPRCRGKTIRRMSGEHGTFWGCMNFPQCWGQLPACMKCEESALEPYLSRGEVAHFACTRCGERGERCGRCGKGALVLRKGSRGRFFGCSTWKKDGTGCGYTRSVS
jgi:DNA helicase IV